MKNSTIMKTGIVGAVLAALCCFTPVLVILLGAIGLSALTGYLDMVLLPALAIFIGVIIYAAVRKNRGSCATDAGCSDNGK